MQLCLPPSPCTDKPWGYGSGFGAAGGPRCSSPMRTMRLPRHLRQRKPMHRKVRRQSPSPPHDIEAFSARHATRKGTGGGPSETGRGVWQHTKHYHRTHTTVTETPVSMPLPRGRDFTSSSTCVLRILCVAWHFTLCVCMCVRVCVCVCVLR